MRLRPAHKKGRVMRVSVSVCVSVNVIAKGGSQRYSTGSGPLYHVIACDSLPSFWFVASQDAGGVLRIGQAERDSRMQDERMKQGGQVTAAAPPPAAGDSSLAGGDAVANPPLAAGAGEESVVDAEAGGSEEAAADAELADGGEESDDDGRPPIIVLLLAPCWTLPHRKSSTALIVASGSISTTFPL